MAKAKDRSFGQVIRDRRRQLDLTQEPKTIDITWTDGDNKGKTYPGVSRWRATC